MNHDIGKYSNLDDKAMSDMQSYGETTEQQKAVGTWHCGYAERRQSFDEIKHHHTLNEVGDVAECRNDWKIERGRGGKSF